MTTVSTVNQPDSDQEYRQLETMVAERARPGPLFRTDVEGLFETYLVGLPSDRQHYNCNACRRFIERYGGLVTVDDGLLTPLFWPGITVLPSFFTPSLVEMHNRVASARITDVFLSSEATWGTPFNTPGPPSKYVGRRWTHLHCANPSVFKHPLRNAEQAMAEKKEEHGMLCRGLADFCHDAVVQAVRVLEADAVDRSEKALGVAKWLLDLHVRLAGKGRRVRDNLIWLAVATAPPGWSHVRTTMIGTLLEDVVAGLPYESIRRRWAEKMHPLQYQRPQTVTEGNLEQANKIVEKLGSAGSLARRFARLTDVTALWRPQPMPEAPKPKGRPFDHLMPSAKGKIKEVQLPPKSIGWAEFRDKVLPLARKLEVVAPAHGGYYGLVAPVNPEAPPLLQWDNGVSWYFYHGGSYATNWSLTPGWVNVMAVMLKPCYWTDPTKFTHQGGGIFFALEGAKDTRYKCGGCFFPETLRSEYHEIRSAMEAYAQRSKIEGRDEGDANGIALDDGKVLRLRVDGSQEYDVRGEK